MSCDVEHPNRASGEADSKGARWLIHLERSGRVPRADELVERSQRSLTEIPYANRLVCTGAGDQVLLVVVDARRVDDSSMRPIQTASSALVQIHLVDFTLHVHCISIIHPKSNHHPQ